MFNAWFVIIPRPPRPARCFVSREEMGRYDLWFVLFISDAEKNYFRGNIGSIARFINKCTDEIAVA